MAQMIRRELGFVTSLVPLQGDPHDAGVVDKDVEGGVGFEEFACKGVYGSRVHQIHWFDSCVGYSIQVVGGFAGVPGRYEDFCAD